MERLPRRLLHHHPPIVLLISDRAAGLDQSVKCQSTVALT
jgi:hypothetical protein